MNAPVSIAAQIYHLVAEKTAQPVTPDLCLHTLDDELTFIELCMRVEDEFIITIADAEMEEIKTVADMVKIVGTKVGDPG